MNLSMEYIVLFFSSVSAFGSIIAVVYLGAVKISRLELKVDTMWSFQMRKAFSEAVSSGAGSMNSPLHFTDEALRHLDPIKDRLVALWNRKDRTNDSDADVILEIEREFGLTLTNLANPPYNMSNGARLLLALSVAKGDAGIKVS